MEKRVRLGLVGCGNMMYSHCLSILEAGVDIVAFCDVVLERAQETSKIVEGAYVTDDYRNLVGKCDAVLCALPHHLHYEIGMFFAKNKVHVLMEKTMCNTDAECERLVKTAEENGAIGYHTATWAAHGTRLGWVLDIHTEKGLIHYDREDGEILFYDKSKQRTPGEINPRDYEVVWTEDGKKSKQTQFEIRHFADCVLNGKTPLTNGYRTMQGLKVINRLYDAEHTGIVADLRGLGHNE